MSPAKQIFFKNSILFLKNICSFFLKLLLPRMSLGKFKVYYFTTVLLQPLSLYSFNFPKIGFGDPLSYFCQPNRQSLQIFRLGKYSLCLYRLHFPVLVQAVFSKSTCAWKQKSRVAHYIWHFLGNISVNIYKSYTLLLN